MNPRLHDLKKKCMIHKQTNKEKKEEKRDTRDKKWIQIMMLPLNGGRCCPSIYVLSWPLYRLLHITLVTNSNDRLVKLCEIRRNWFLNRSAGGPKWLNWMSFDEKEWHKILIIWKKCENNWPKTKLNPTNTAEQNNFQGETEYWS